MPQFEQGQQGITLLSLLKPAYVTDMWLCTNNTEQNRTEFIQT